MPSFLVIGTAPDCDVLVRSEYASAHHARVSQNGGLWWVEDLGSTNGTQLRRGGATIRVTARQPLQLGDVIVVGRVQIPWHPRAVEPYRTTAVVGPRREDV